MRACSPVGTSAGIGTFSVQEFIITELLWGGWVARSRPVGESRWISIGAPGAKSLPVTAIVPPAATLCGLAVRATTATHAQATAAGTSPAAATTIPTSQFRREVLIGATPFTRSRGFTPDFRQQF